MSYQQEGYELDFRGSAAEASALDRAAFVRRVYAHLAGAILLLVAIEAVLLNTFAGLAILKTIAQTPMAWLVMLLLFMGGGWVAQMWARSQTSVAMQYLGLVFYVALWSIMMLPLLFIASLKAPDIIPQAAVMTGAMFGGLTLAVFTTRKDFSFLGPIISVGFMIALGVIVCACLFGFTLGLLFSFAMVALICASILYNTSNVMLHYPTDMHVAASLELFADVALLFMYIVRILMATRE
jgi:hypothetical protein